MKKISCDKYMRRKTKNLTTFIRKMLLVETLKMLNIFFYSPIQVFTVYQVPS